MSEPIGEPIIKSPQREVLETRGQQISQEIIKDGYSDIVYLDKSGRPLRLFLEKNIDPNLGIKSSFLSVGNDQVMGYFGYLHEMSKTNPEEYQKRFGSLGMYLDNIYMMYHFNPGLSRTQSPRLETNHLELQAIHEFFNKKDIEKIQLSMKARYDNLGTQRLKIYFVDDLEGSGITLQFARALVEILGNEVGIEVETGGDSFLGYLRFSPTAKLFQRSAFMKPNMPWSEFGSRDKQNYHFIEDAGPRRLISRRIGSARQKARARKLYREIIEN